MAYQTVGAEGKLVSLGDSNFYSDLYGNVNWNNCRLTIQTETHDVTGLDVEAAASIAGLKSWTMTLSGEAIYGSVIRVGNAGLVTYSAGYALHVNSWDLALEAAVHDITEFTSGTAPDWRSFRPDMSRWSGTYEAMADSGTAPSGLAVAGTAPASATFKYGEEATTDDTLSGTILVTPLDVSVSRGQTNTFRFGFVGSGALTPAGDNTLVGTTAFGIPLWNLGSTAVGPVVLASLTGSRTFTGADSFWSRIGFRCQVGQPTQVDLQLQGTGALTIS